MLAKKNQTYMVIGSSSIIPLKYVDAVIGHGDVPDGIIIEFNKSFKLKWYYELLKQRIPCGKVELRFVTAGKRKAVSLLTVSDISKMVDERSLYISLNQPDIPKRDGIIQTINAIIFKCYNILNSGLCYLKK